METVLPRALLLPFFLLYFLLAFVWRSWLVYRREGINPLVLPAADDAYGYVGRCFKLVIGASFALVLLLAASPAAPGWLGEWPALARMRWLEIAGWVLLLLSLVWLLIAQMQMGSSWRIGIDEVHRTELVSRGLFALSRNPIFLAMRVNLLGLFCVFPAAATLAILVAGEILMQVQVRLEEQHLQALHGAAYEEYRARVRRWL